MRKRRVIGSILGIPIVLLTAIFLFFIGQTSYDLIVGDRNLIRVVLLCSSLLGLVVLLSLSFLKVDTLINVARKHIGGD